jgi:formate dehydrogenase subunit gamma
MTLPLLATGLWLLVGREGQPSILARVTGVSDTRLHIWLGWALAGVVVVALVAGARAIPAFVRESIRHDRGDLGWFRRWPRGVLTGRFGRHEGEFDPGQRIANLAIVIGMLVLVITGVGLAALHGGHLFARLAKIHKWTAIVMTPVLLGHWLIASGVLPGYRGVWRSMHLGGRVREETARRLWPGWTEERAPFPANGSRDPKDSVDRTSVERWDGFG